MGFGPSSSIIGDGARKFERFELQDIQIKLLPFYKISSARSRYQRLQVPFSQVKWIVCDQCGDVVSRMDYKEHVSCTGMGNKNEANNWAQFRSRRKNLITIIKV
jgi:hypothetical protein